MLWSSGCRQDDFVKPFWLQTREKGVGNGGIFWVWRYFEDQDAVSLSLLKDSDQYHWPRVSYFQLDFLSHLHPQLSLARAPTPCCTEQGFAQCQSLLWNLSSRAGFAQHHTAEPSGTAEITHPMFWSSLLVWRRKQCWVQEISSCHLYCNNY